MAGVRVRVAVLAGPSGAQARTNACHARRAGVPALSLGVRFRVRVYVRAQSVLLGRACVWTLQYAPCCVRVSAAHLGRGDRFIRVCCGCGGGGGGGVGLGQTI